VSEVLFSGRHILADRAGPVATIRFNRPEKLNALIPEMREDLLRSFDAVEKTAEVRVIVLTGEGRGFCAGGDVEYLLQLKESGDREGFCRILDEGTEIVRRFRASPKPTIAAINGPAVGGGLILALACDLRFAAESAVLGMPFARVGMGPDWGGTWMLTRLAGTARALDLFFTARLVSAREALATGLVNQVFPDSRLPGEVRAVAERIAEFEPDIHARYKRAVYAAEGGDLESALEVERRCQLEFFDHDEFADRVGRFLEGRRGSA
jgi:enoyl-CoA hydratase/carnithine racemase